MVGGFGIVDSDSHIRVSVDCGQNTLQGGVFVEAAHHLIVDLELIQKFALVVHSVIFTIFAVVALGHFVTLGIHIVGIGRGVLSGLHIDFFDLAFGFCHGKLAPVRVLQDISQCLAGVDIGAGAASQAKRLGRIAGNRHSRAFLNRQLQRERIPTADIVEVHFNLTSAEAIVQLLLQRLEILRIGPCVPIRLSIVGQSDLLCHTVQSDRQLLTGEIVPHSAVLIHKLHARQVQTLGALGWGESQSVFDIPAGRTDVDIVASAALVIKFNAFAVDAHSDSCICLHHCAVRKRHALLAQLFVNRLGQLVGAAVNIQFTEVDGIGPPPAIVNRQ